MKQSMNTRADDDSYLSRQELPHLESDACLLKTATPFSSSEAIEVMTRFSLNDSHFEEPRRGAEC
ncbi:MAG TPA: hypothetical protein VGE52_18465 [Pirellulales bacterium]|jgi:hypothetical protein